MSAKGSSLDVRWKTWTPAPSFTSVSPPIQHACPEQPAPARAQSWRLTQISRTMTFAHWLVNVVARVQRIEVLEALLELTDGGRSLLGRFRLPLKTPVLLGAIRALADTWAFDDRVAVVLTAALEFRSRHPRRRLTHDFMSDPARFLNAFAQALGVMTLYPDGHPSRERAVDLPSTSSTDWGVLSGIPRSCSSTMRWSSGVSACASSSRGTGDAGWSCRHPADGVRAKVSRDEFNGFLDEVGAADAVVR